MIAFYLQPGAQKYFALIIFVAASFTDFLDGYIARKHNLVTDFGKLMDPIADKILVASALIILTEAGRVYGWVVLIIIAREFLVSGVRMLAASNGKVIAADMSGKIKTVTQMAAIMLFLMIDPKASTGWIVVCANVLLYTSVVLAIYSGWEYIKGYGKLF